MDEDEREKNERRNWARQGNEKKAKGKVKKRLMNRRIGKSDGVLRKRIG